MQKIITLKSKSGLSGVVASNTYANWSEMKFTAEDVEIFISDGENYYELIDYYGMLLEFHRKYRHYVGMQPQKHGTIPQDIYELRDKLIEEEFKEFREAGSREDIADSLADLLYVVFGAALAYGIPINKVFKEVHRSNMTKSMLKDEKSIKGKTLKGEDYEPPKIKEIIQEAMGETK